MRHLLFRGISVLFMVLLSGYGSFCQNERYADSLINELKHAEGKHFIEVSNNLCRYYMNSNPDLALSYAYISLHEAYKNNLTNEKILAYNLFGIIYNNKNQYDSAFINFNKSINLAYFIRDTNHIASILNNIGFINYRLCNYTEALNNFNQSLNYYEHFGDSTSIGSAYNNIGLIYFELKEYQKALLYYKKALEVGKKVKTPTLLGPSLLNIGFVHTRIGETAKAWLYLDSALAYCRKANDKFNEAKIYKERGIICIANKDYVNALKQLLIAEEFNLKLKNPIELASIYERQSECYIALNSLDKALELARKGLRYAKIVVYKKYLVRAYKNLSDIYERKKDYRQALKFYRQSIEINDEILDNQKISQIYNMQLQHEMNRNADQIAELNRQRQIQSIQIEKQKLIIGQKNLLIAIVLIIAVFSVILAYILYKYYLNKQSMKLEMAVHSIKEQRAREVLEAENRERKRIGEELHESLSQILLLAKLTVSSLKIKDPVLTTKQCEIVNNSINLLNTAFEELRNISHNLTPFLLKEKGLIVSIKEMLNKIGNANHWIVHFEEIGFEKRLDNFLETTLYRVIQEILSNIIRHAEATEINCQLIRAEKDLTIMIEDNGKGFEVSQLKQSDGIGIHNIYSRIENLNGTVLIDSVMGRGTIFTIIVPLTKRKEDEQG
ncbi:MAG: tetratricopeptide repeat protein [Bacteroidales bacterium]|nr:tetratricopeptide repeat protein [Bacteroidales bacterium]